MIPVYGSHCKELGLTMGDGIFNFNYLLKSWRILQVELQILINRYRNISVNVLQNILSEFNFSKSIGVFSRKIIVWEAEQTSGVDSDDFVE